VLQQSLIFLAVNILAFLNAFAALPLADFIREGLAHGLAIGLGSVVNFIGHKTLTFSLGGTHNVAATGAR
jgi:hypothetical protein